MRATGIVGFIVAVLMAQGTAAGQDSGAARPWSGCFKAFEIRKAFDGGKDEAQPAVVSVVAVDDDLPNDASESGAYVIDVGIRNKRCSLVQADWGEISAGVSGEWHLGQVNALREEKKRNKAKGGATLYVSRTVVQRLDAAGDETFSARLWFVLKAEGGRDFVDDTTATTVALTTSPTIITNSMRSFWPGEALTIGAVTLAYYPTTGAEYLRKLKIGNVAPAFEGWDWLVRVETVASFGVSGQGEIDGRFQVAAEHARRWRISGLETLSDGALGFSSATATVWVDDKRRVGVGYSFDSGRSPATNFIAQRRNSIGVQLKF